MPGIPCLLFFLWVSVCVVWAAMSMALANSESLDFPPPICNGNNTAGEHCAVPEKEVTSSCDWDSYPECPGFYELPEACNYSEPSTCNAKALMHNCSVNLFSTCEGVIPNGTEWVGKGKGRIKTHHSCNSTVLTKCNATLQEYEGWEENWNKATVLDCILHADEDICDAAELPEECYVVEAEGKRASSAGSGSCVFGSCDEDQDQDFEEEEEEGAEEEEEEGLTIKVPEPCDVRVVEHLASCKAAKSNATRVCKAAKDERAKIRNKLKKTGAKKTTGAKKEKQTADSSSKTTTKAKAKTATKGTKKEAPKSTGKPDRKSKKVTKSSDKAKPASTKKTTKKKTTTKKKEEPKKKLLTKKKKKTA